MGRRPGPPRSSEVDDLGANASLRHSAESDLEARATAKLDVVTVADTDEQEKISEDEAVVIATKHLDWLTRLLLIPMPLIVAVMVSLARAKDPITIFGIEYPRVYAEMTARFIVLIIFAQATLHITLLVSIVSLYGRSSKLRRALTYHPGPFNPFFVFPPLNVGEKSVSRVVRATLLPRMLSAQIGVGFIFGFAVGFRTDLAPGEVASWARFFGDATWPFSSSTSNALFAKANEIYLERHAPNLFDAIDDIALFTMSAGAAICISSIIAFAALSESAARWMRFQLTFGAVVGFAAATVASWQLAVG